MAKIPVGATLAQAGRFVVRDFLRILGVSALPLAIMWIPSLLMRHQMSELSAQIAAHDFSAIQKMLAVMVPFYVVMLLLMTMQMIGIARLALGMQRGWFYFSLGKPVWRLIGSMLLLFVAMVIGWLIALLGGLLVSFLLGLLSRAVSFPAFTATMGFATAAILIAIWCGYFYCLVRLTFLLLPVIAAQEDGFALGNAWTLGKGNFWRMFAIVLVILIPLLVIEFGVVFAWLFKGLSFPAHADAGQLAAFNAAIHDRTLAMTEAMFQYWYLTFPATIIFCVVFYGFAVGAQCFAYKALQDVSTPVPGDGLPD